MPPPSQDILDELFDSKPSYHAYKRGRWCGIRGYLSHIIVAGLASSFTFGATQYFGPVNTPYLASSIFSSPKVGDVTLLDIPNVMTSCGKFKDEAIALGCSFDPLALGWLPSSCPRYMTEEFLNFSETQSVPWSYWSDVEGEKGTLLSEVEMSAAEWYWTTNGEHLTHCVFVILRFYTATNNGEKSHRLARSTSHAHHCLIWLLDIAQTWDGWGAVGTKGKVGFDEC